MTLFEKLASEIGLGPVCTEYRFHEKRKWRFDYAWPDTMSDYLAGVGNGGVALEVEGGAFTQGRHTRGKGFVQDIQKYNEAVCLGWRIIRCTPQQRDDGSILETLRRLV